MTYRITIVENTEYDGTDGKKYERDRAVYQQTVDDLNVPALVNFINKQDHPKVTATTQ